MMIFKADGTNPALITDIDEDNGSFTNYVAPAVGDPLTVAKLQSTGALSVSITSRFLVGYSDHTIELRKKNNSTWVRTGTTQKEMNIAIEHCRDTVVLLIGSQDNFIEEAQYSPTSLTMNLNLVEMLHPINSIQSITDSHLVFVAYEALSNKYSVMDRTTFTNLLAMQVDSVDVIQFLYTSFTNPDLFAISSTNTITKINATNQDVLASATNTLLGNNVAIQEMRNIEWIMVLTSTSQIMAYDTNLVEQYSRDLSPIIGSISSSFAWRNNRIRGSFTSDLPSVRPNIIEFKELCHPLCSNCVKLP